MLASSTAGSRVHPSRTSYGRDLRNDRLPCTSQRLTPEDKCEQVSEPSVFDQRRERRYHVYVHRLRVPHQASFRNEGPSKDQVGMAWNRETLARETRAKREAVTAPEAPRMFSSIIQRIGIACLLWLITNIGEPQYGGGIGVGPDGFRTITRK